MPPEQLLSRQLTTGSDLYSLGATLVCLLAGLKSASITDLIDETYCININLLPQSLTLTLRFG
jgi:serine/threonine protein kinase